jgi:hypothetical protein
MNCPPFQPTHTSMRTASCARGPWLTFLPRRFVDGSLILPSPGMQPIFAVGRPPHRLENECCVPGRQGGVCVRDAAAAFGLQPAPILDRLFRCSYLRAQAKTGERRRREVLKRSAQLAVAWHRREIKGCLERDGAADRSMIDPCNPS